MTADRPRTPFLIALARRALGMLGGYYVHRGVTLWLGVFDGPAATLPSGLALLLSACAVAALLAGYAAAMVAGGSLRTARLLGIALAIVAVLAALQRLEQGLPVLSRHVALVVAAPLTSIGGWFALRHRARLRG